jgi:hypothetical protein
MKVIVTESQVKRLLNSKQIDEGLLGGLIDTFAKSSKNFIERGKNFIKGGKNVGKSTVKQDIVKPVTDTLERIKQQKNNLAKKGIKVLRQGELPRKFYHGSSKKITFNDLSVSALEKSRVKHSTGSSGMDGMYFTENLWDNMSHHNQYKNPVYSQGNKSVSAESAESYAQTAIKNKQKGYIYEMELTPDAIIVPAESLSGINTARITEADMAKLKSMGIDGIYRNKIELVILNKRALKSFNLKYTGDKFVGSTKKNAFGDKVPTSGSYGFNWTPQ